MSSPQASGSVRTPFRANVNILPSEGKGRTFTAITQSSGGDAGDGGRMTVSLRSEAAEAMLTFEVSAAQWGKVQECDSGALLDRLQRTAEHLCEHKSLLLLVGYGPQSDVVERILLVSDQEEADSFMTGADSAGLNWKTRPLALPTSPALHAALGSHVLMWVKFPVDDTPINFIGPFEDLDQAYDYGRASASASAWAIFTRMENRLAETISAVDEGEVGARRERVLRHSA